MGRKQVTIRAAALAAAAGLLAPWGAAVSQPALVELELEPIEIVGLIEVEPEAPPLEELVVAELGLAPVQAVAPEFESVEVVTLEPTVAQPVRSRSVMVSSDDGTTYRIEIEDGDMLAMIDGQPIAPERVEVLEDGFVILGKNGEKLKAFTLPTPPDAPKIVTRLGQRSGPAVVSVAPNLNVDVSVDRDWASPKVMVGLAWEEPSEALRYHLNIDGDKKALLVTRVVDGLPADKAGLRKYDVIIAVDGDRLGSYGLGEALEGKKPGDDLELTVRRGSRTVDLEIELAEYSRSKLGLAATSAVSVPAAPAEPKALWTTRTPAAPAAPTPPEWADAKEENRFVMRFGDGEGWVQAFGDDQREQIEAALAASRGAMEQALASLRERADELDGADAASRRAKREIEKAMEVLRTQIDGKIQNELKGKLAELRKEQAFVLRDGELVFLREQAKRDAEKYRELAEREAKRARELYGRVEKREAEREVRRGALMRREAEVRREKEGKAHHDHGGQHKHEREIRVEVESHEALHKAHAHLKEEIKAMRKEQAQMMKLIKELLERLGERH